MKINYQKLTPQDLPLLKQLLKIFEEVFEIDDKDPELILWSAHHGINTIDDLLQLRETEIVSSTFKLDDGTVKPLWVHMKNYIHALIAFKN